MMMVLSVQNEIVQFVFFVERIAQLEYTILHVLRRLYDQRSNKHIKSGSWSP